MTNRGAGVQNPATRIPYRGRTEGRYGNATEAKAGGVTYTPPVLADFVAERILSVAELPEGRPVRVLDPAVGHGELLLSLLKRIDSPVEVNGYETDGMARDEARRRLIREFPEADIRIELGNFLDHVPEGNPGTAESHDIIIANPPYVRTQVMGAIQARQLAEQFGLSGRVDLYHAFLLGMARVLSPRGTAGFIVSNRFMTTRGGATVRAGMLANLNLTDVIDLGDTRLFRAAVLPAVLIARGRTANGTAPRFRSIYETSAPAARRTTDPLAALEREGTVAVPGGRTFMIRHGHLDNGGDPSGVWRLASDDVESWLAAVASHTCGTFRDIGKIRVGVKTCADRIFLPRTWDEDLELHRPLTTHHIARRFRPVPPSRKILYPHEAVRGRMRAVDLRSHPRSRAYLEKHREVLEARRYLTGSGRKWYEIWVPQNAADWPRPKLVFRDISERPTFWLDLAGTVVNGDCYWLTGDEDRLWLALGVANSTFIECFYDRRFNNRLYAGRRRFMTQYVERFPLPDPGTRCAGEIAATCRDLYVRMADGPAPDMERRVNELVWSAFGLPVEEAPG